MTKGTLPPQAYTREMLTQAFQWVQTQPESIRKLADSADALVGLFLRAKRSGDANLENSAPVSTENFRKSLKSLATELEQFSGPTPNLAAPLATTASSHASFPPAPPIAQPVSQASKQTVTQASTHTIPNQFVLDLPDSVINAETKPSNFHFQPRINVKAETAFLDKPTAPDVTDSFNKLINPVPEFLDAKSHAVLVKVQNRFNLSTENEALRLLISIGAERLEQL